MKANSNRALKKTPALHASELNVVGNPNDGLASQPGVWAGGGG